MKNINQRYADFVSYLRTLPIKPYQIAHLLHLMQNVEFDLETDGYATPPHTVNFAVNNQCNLRCHYCDLHHGRVNKELHNAKIDFGVIDATKKYEMPLEVCKRIIDEVSWFRPTIRVPWMEPLLYKDLFKVIEYTKDKDLDFSMLTNGLLLKKYAPRLCELKVDALRVSLDGPEEIHDKSCGINGAYRQIVDGLKYIADQNDKGACAMQIGLYFTLTDLNYNHLTTLVESLDKEGLVGRMSISFYMFNYVSERQVAAHNKEHAEMSGVRISEASTQYVSIEKIYKNIDVILDQVKVIQEKYPDSRIHFRPGFTAENLRQCLQDEDLSLPDSRCDVLNHTLYINPDGDVKLIPQCILKPIGNIFENSIMDIWNGEAARNMRKTLKKQHLFHGCTRCWCAYYGLEDSQNTWK